MNRSARQTQCSLPSAFYRVTGVTVCISHQLVPRSSVIYDACHPVRHRVFRIDSFVMYGVDMFGRCAAILLLASVLLSLTGCNTVAGLGQDISGSARTVQHAF